MLIYPFLNDTSLLNTLAIIDNVMLQNWVGKCALTPVTREGVELGRYKTANILVGNSSSILNQKVRSFSEVFRQECCPSHLKFGFFCKQGKFGYAVVIAFPSGPKRVVRNAVAGHSRQYAGRRVLSKEFQSTDHSDMCAGRPSRGFVLGRVKGGRGGVQTHPWTCACQTCDQSPALSTIDTPHTHAGTPHNDILNRIIIVPAHIVYRFSSAYFLHLPQHDYLPYRAGQDLSQSRYFHIHSS
jgi:hypothetical protein